MSVEALRVGIASGEIDTVLLALTDMQGRLQGKRLHAQYFLDEVLAHGSEACNYLLAVDVEMNTLPGYAISGWETGYGDFVLVPDLDTLRPVPWLPGTVIVLADLRWPSGGDVVESPRQILRRQLDLLQSEHGLTAWVGTELEFVAFADTYEQAAERGYRGLTPVNQYNVDYSLLGTSRVEPLLRRIRLQMAGAGLEPESAKGECNPGQHEIAFRYTDALRTADQHILFKHGTKEIAAQEGCSITFMAKPNQREGNSCHIHFSLRDADGRPVMGIGDELTPTGAAVVAGLIATARDVSVLVAPNINSYKRYQRGSFAPTALRWGRDNRTCAMRVVGHDASLRVENRVPGADVNPYLAIAALVAGARHGLSAGLSLEDAYTGNAYADPDAPRVPGTLGEALALWRASDFVRDAFGNEVVAHYARAAEVELEAFNAAVTDWELIRGYERL
ncbi:glutamine synthetase [Allocatelliglobosispora scoriae]|uniref:Glutamine synthetase n=1 Tax=Allocatelliglobosispora scoriae TaxID=643052 RepID=A0A841BT57_9ACTN|nr:glutamine synthetase family protein [Allocatelliglobosispora scoriae]MBB5872267.1 glutamine synthetase [Allocatelliglobosispora scoriae]